jgi:hypothetical protein
MRRRRAKLPEVTHKHLSGLQIVNDTGYDTRAIRSLMIRALRAQGMRVRGAVRIAYSSQELGHHGCAALGDSVHVTGLNMALSVPRDPAKFSVREFALVMRHEAMHWRGVLHGDMSDDQRYCRGELPEWAEGIVVAHRTEAPPSADEIRVKKVAHAQTMLKRAETRLRRAETFVKKWKRRVAAAERAAKRAFQPAAEAADGS